jgi:hypothetical protein
MANQHSADEMAWAHMGAVSGQKGTQDYLLRKGTSFNGACLMHMCFNVMQLDASELILTDNFAWRTKQKPLGGNPKKNVHRHRVPPYPAYTQIAR